MRFRERSLVSWRNEVYEKGMKLVFALASAALLFASACNASPAQKEAFEASEAAEESVGDEETLLGRNPDDMDDWDDPGNEVEAIEEAEPYPE